MSYSFLRIAKLLVGLALLAGCAGDGYVWKQVRPEVPQDEWTYIEVDDPHTECMKFGLKGDRGRILGCATWAGSHCIIIVPKNSPRWITEHEERHCKGWTHD